MEYYYMNYFLLSIDYELKIINSKGDFSWFASEENLFKEISGLKSLIHDDYLPDFAKLIQKKTDFENYYFFLKDSRSRWHYAKCKAEFSSDFISLTIEFTHIKSRFENLASDLEKSFAHLWETMVDVYYKIDIYGNYIDISPSIKDFTGYTRENLIGRNAADELYVYPELREKFIEELKKDGKTSCFEIPIWHKSGEIRWASSSAHLVYDDKGKLAGFEGITRNITRKKEAELEVRNSFALLEKVFESTLTMVACLDQNLYIKSCNKALEINLNKNKNELTGTNIDQLPTKINISQLIKNMQNDPILENSVPVMIEGTEKYWDINITPVELKSQGEIGYIITAYDVTDRFVYEKLLKKQKSKLEKMNKNLNQIVNEEIEKRRQQEEMLLHSSKLASLGEMQKTFWKN